MDYNRQREIEAQLKAKKQLMYEKFRQHTPSEMLEQKRWVRYFLKPKEDGQGTAKIPLGNHSDETTWSNFHEAFDKIENEPGLGYCFYKGDIHGLDLDHCRNPKTGIICNEAMLLLSRLGSWAEYSVSGQGIHVLFKGNVRGKQLGETCLQYWNPKNSPRFFAMTCNMVGEAFTTLKDIGDDFNYIFATARHISAKIREELKEVDPEQWAALPVELEPVAEHTKEKPKHKTRKVAKDFDIYDFLKFYGLNIDNETDNDLGHCIRLTSCPIKGEKHVGQNGTSTNFIYPTKDGGLGFHCQSTGCVEYSVAQVIEHLATEKGPYPKPIYEVPQESTILSYALTTLEDVAEEPIVWLWPGYLPHNKLVHFMGPSSEGKSPVDHDLIARITAGLPWPDGAPNTLGPRSVLLMSAEDNLADTVKPRVRLAGGDSRKVKLFEVVKRHKDLQTEISVALDRDLDGLINLIRQIDDLALITIDPITNYLGEQGMNNEADIRTKILMPLVDVARAFNTCIVTIGHLNKREAATVLQKGMGATAFTGVPRKVFLFGGDPEDTDKYTHVMKEVRDKEVTLKYRTKKVQDPKQPSGVIQVEWLGAVERDADEMVSQPKQRDKTAAKEIESFMKIILRDGAKPTKVIVEGLKEAGIDVEKIGWQRFASRVAKNRPITGKGKGAGHEWYLPTPEQAEFDVSKPNSEKGRLTA